MIILHITGISIVYCKCSNICSLFLCTDCVLFVAIIQLIPIVGGSDAIDYFFCSDPTVIVSFFESTAYCQIYGKVIECVGCALCIAYLFTGFAIQATLMGFVVVWLLFIFHLFLKIVFPIASQNLFKNHGTKLYIAEIILGLVTSLITPIAAIATDGFFITSYPPVQCLSNPSIQFHGVILPAILITIVGISLILITVLTVHRVSCYIKTHCSESCGPIKLCAILGITTGEKKISVPPIIGSASCIGADIGILGSIGVGYLGNPIPINSHLRQSSSS